MVDQKEYISTGITIALSILAVSAIYFIEISNPKTFVFSLAPVILFSYTAQNSENNFRRSSLGSLTSLILVPVGGLTAILSIFIAFMNPLISYFAEDKGFKNYYSSTALPLIIIGILAGTLVIFGSLASTEFNQGLQNQTNQIVNAHTGIVLDYVGSDQDLGAVETTAESTVAMTESIVVEELHEDRSDEELEEIRESFDEAREEAPDEIKGNLETQSDQQSIREEQAMDTVETLTKEFYEGSTIYSILILAPFLFYSFQPVLGIFTALFASLIARIELE